MKAYSPTLRSGRMLQKTSFLIVSTHSRDIEYKNCRGRNFDTNKTAQVAIVEALDAPDVADGQLAVGIDIAKWLVVIRRILQKGAVIQFVHYGSNHLVDCALGVNAVVGRNWPADDPDVDLVQIAANARALRIVVRLASQVNVGRRKRFLRNGQ